MISRSDVEKLSEDFFRENKARIISELLRYAKVETEEELWDKEYHMGFGLDCGIVYIVPYDPETTKVWKKDDPYRDARLHLRYPYQTQSTTLQEIQATMLVEYLEEKTGEKFGTYTWID